MSNITYIARLGHCDDGICVSFPDLPGCFTEGKTKDNAIEMAKEALKLWLNVAEDEKDHVVISNPRRLDEIEVQSDGALDEYEDSFEFVSITVDVDDESYADSEFEEAKTATA